MIRLRIVALLSLATVLVFWMRDVPWRQEFRADSGYTAGWTVHRSILSPPEPASFDGFRAKFPSLRAVEPGDGRICVTIDWGEWLVRFLVYAWMGACGLALAYVPMRRVHRTRTFDAVFAVASGGMVSVIASLVIWMACDLFVPPAPVVVALLGVGISVVVYTRMQRQSSAGKAEGDRIS